MVKYFTIHVSVCVSDRLSAQWHLNQLRTPTQRTEQQMKSKVSYAYVIVSNTLPSKLDKKIK